jgi:CheY-like chemotaxis protein
LRAARPCGRRLSAVAQTRDLSYRVIEVEDGPQALKLLGSNEPVDLLMTDMVMPADDRMATRGSRQTATAAT